LEKGSKYLLFLAGAIRSLKKGGRAGIVLPSGILFGDTSSHIEVKQRLLAECDLQAVIILPKGIFEPYTPNETCVLIFEKTGKISNDVWFYKMDGDGSSLKKARKFGPQYRNDFPDLLSKWPNRDTEEGRSWLVPASKIIENNYNMTLTGLGLLVPEIEVFPPANELIVEIDTHNQKVNELIQFIQKSLIK
jgi:type I restriction enzyme M protein